MGHYEYDHRKDSEMDSIKLYWQVQALRGQIRELERERERTGNLLWLMRRLIITLLMSVGVPQDELRKKNDADLLARFSHEINHNWRFSLCPDAIEYHCRPSAMQLSRDGDLIHCGDCGWDVRENPLPENLRPNFTVNPSKTADSDTGVSTGKTG